MANLEAKLKAAAKQVTAKEYGLQAYDQLGMARTRFELLKSLLGERFKPTELTFSRYFVAGEQTYLAVLDNLDSIASRLQSVSTIDERQITARIEAIGRQKKIPPADVEEIGALKARLALREAQLDHINTLLTFNENAITEFDRVNNASRRGQRHARPGLGRPGNGDRRAGSARGKGAQARGMKRGTMHDYGENNA